MNDFCAVSHDLARYMREQELLEGEEIFQDQRVDEFAEAAAGDPSLIAGGFDDDGAFIEGLTLARTSTDPAMRAWYDRCLGHAGVNSAL
ncbi:MAG: hypothetical protein ACREXX_16435 [Gammaproteobacteria bacterium]